MVAGCYYGEIIYVETLKLFKRKPKVDLKDVHIHLSGQNLICILWV
jgi:hypothetical protein